MSDFFSFIGAADAYVDVLTDTGEKTGLALKGNCTEFVPKPDSERKEQTATGRSNYGQVLAAVTLPKPMTATIKFNQVDADLFAAAFFGTNTALTQAAVFTPADVDVECVLDKYVEIGKYMITVNAATGVVNKTLGNEALAEGVDYEINTRLGMIQALSTSTKIADGDTLTVSYTCAAVAGSSMAAMTRSNVRIRVMLDGQNYADGRNFIADIYQLRLSPSSDFSLVGTDFVEVTFEGTLETPTGEDEPMKHIWLS